MDRKQSLKLFGITDAATLKELQTAYRKGVKQWHPDRFQQEEDSARLVAEQKMRELNIAFELLSAYYAKHGHFRESLHKPATHNRPSPNYYKQAPSTPVVEEEPEIIPVKKEHSRRERVWSAVALSILAAIILFSGLLPEQNKHTLSDNKMLAQKADTVTQQQSAKNSEYSSEENQAAVKQEMALVEKLKKPEVEPEEKTAFETRSIFTEQQPVDPEEPFFTYGDTMGKVYDVQGIPTQTDGDIWYYGASMVKFKNGRVVSWENTGKLMLKARF